MEVSGKLHALATLHAGKNSGTHWIGGWAATRTSLDITETIKSKFESYSNFGFCCLLDNYLPKGKNYSHFLYKSTGWNMAPQGTLTIWQLLLQKKFK